LGVPQQYPDGSGQTGAGNPVLQSLDVNQLH
jgi:hypothetical protein